MILNGENREGKRLRWLWKCLFWKDNVAKQCDHTFSYCIRSCSSSVSLRGVVKNPMTCIKAFCILHYIFCPLAQVWRADLCSWPPGPWLSTALRQGWPTLFFWDIFCRSGQDTAYTLALASPFGVGKFLPDRSKGSAVSAHQDCHYHVSVPFSCKCVNM